MFTMGFAKLRFSLTATFGNCKAQILARRDAKTGCKNLFKRWFSDVFGVGCSDGVSGLRSVRDVIRPACDFSRIRSADFSWGYAKRTARAVAMKSRSDDGSGDFPPSLPGRK